jgi:ATP-binding cassette subfamily F protein uup
MTLQVLEEYIAQFKGCVIVVSHDRYFMDKIAEHLLVFEGDGKITDFPSSYSDYMEYKMLKENEEKAATAKSKSGAQERQPETTVNRPARLTFKEKREMEQIEQELQQLEEEKARLEQELNSGTLPYDQLQQKSARIGQILDLIDTITMRWLQLSEK